MWVHGEQPLLRNAALTPGGKRDPTQGNIVGHNAGGPPRVPQECFSKQHPWATADSGSDRAIIMFVASRTLSKCRPCCCHSEDLNGCVGLKHSRDFPEFSYNRYHWFSYRHSFPRVEPSMGFLQSVSRARCSKHDNVSHPQSFLQRL